MPLKPDQTEPGSTSRVDEDGAKGSNDTHKPCSNNSDTHLAAQTPGNSSSLAEGNMSSRVSAAAKEDQSAADQDEELRKVKDRDQTMQRMKESREADPSDDQRDVVPEWLVKSGLTGLTRIQLDAVMECERAGWATNLAILRAELISEGATPESLENDYYRSDRDLYLCRN